MKFNCSYTDLIETHKLVPNPKNANIHPQKQIDMLAKIIDFQGQRSPIVVSKESGFIVKGHARLMALKLLEWEQVAVDYQSYDTPAQEHADLIADNKIAELAQHDDEKMKFDLKEMNWDLDTELLGFENISFDEDIKDEKIKEKELDENIETDNECPKCGYRY